MRRAEVTLSLSDASKALGSKHRLENVLDTLLNEGLIAAYSLGKDSLTVTPASGIDFEVRLGLQDEILELSMLPSRKVGA